MTTLPRPSTSAGLVDAFGRVATDLRVSVTDRCNLRCSYCMPAEGLDWLPKPQLLTFEELARNGITPDLPDDGSETVKVLTFDIKDGKFFVLDRQSAVPVARLRLTVAYRADASAPDSEPAEKPLDPEDDDYTADVFVKVKEA